MTESWSTSSTILKSTTVGLLSCWNAKFICPLSYQGQSRALNLWTSLDESFWILDRKRSLEWCRTLCGSPSESTALLLQLYVRTMCSWALWYTFPKHACPDSCLGAAFEFLHLDHQTSRFAFLLPKTWVAAFWRTTLSLSKSVLLAHSFTCRNCSTNIFLPSSERISSFLEGLVTLFLLLVKKRQTRGACCSIDLAMCSPSCLLVGTLCPMILSWNRAQNSKSMRLLEFIFPAPCFPMTFGHDFQSLPTQALKSPRIITVSISAADVQPTSFSKNCSFLPAVLAWLTHIPRWGLDCYLPLAECTLT